MTARPLPADVAPLLREYRQLLDQRFGQRLERVALFGSRARGDGSVDSDVDVAVVVAGLTEAERDTAIDLALTAWRSTGLGGPILSPLCWSATEWQARLRAERRIVRDVMEEGIPL